jgi:excinuclease UvrABC ATPase subunit
MLLCVTGVSGGGKSTLTIETLYKAAARRINGASAAPAPHEAVQGLELLDKIIDIDQSPIGRTPRSNPATYTGAFTPIRDWFAALPESLARGYAPGRFSFNVKGGRCEACEGDGVIKIEMHFLPDVYVECDVCHGKRYNRETLEILYKGKSTLTVDTLYAAVARRLNGARLHPAAHERLEGLEYLDKVIDIDQSPIGRTPRSNPATYTGAFTPIREWFAGLPEAKARGYQPGRFSFNVKGGRCEACQGDGVIKIEMHFLPDVYVTCDVCKGKRYNRETLEVTFKGKSIADILDMTVEEAKTFFAAVPSIRDKMETLDRVGLSYIHVGQQARCLNSLSN